MVSFQPVLQGLWSNLAENFIGSLFTYGTPHPYTSDVNIDFSVNPDIES